MLAGPPVCLLTSTHNDWTSHVCSARACYNVTGYGLCHGQMRPRRLCGRAGCLFPCLCTCAQVAASDVCEGTDVRALIGALLNVATQPKSQLGTTPAEHSVPAAHAQARTSAAAAAVAVRAAGRLCVLLDSCSAQDFLELCRAGERAPLSAAAAWLGHCLSPAATPRTTAAAGSGTRQGLRPPASADAVASARGSAAPGVTGHASAGGWEWPAEMPSSLKQEARTAARQLLVGSLERACRMGRVAPGHTPGWGFWASLDPSTLQQLLAQPVAGATGAPNPPRTIAASSTASAGATPEPQQQSATGPAGAVRRNTPQVMGASGSSSSSSSSKPCSKASGSRNQGAVVEALGYDEDGVSAVCTLHGMVHTPARSRTIHTVPSALLQLQGSSKLGWALFTRLPTSRPSLLPTTSCHGSGPLPKLNDSTCDANLPCRALQLRTVWDSRPKPAVAAARAAWKAVPLRERVSWSQTSTDVTVTLLLPPSGTRRSDVMVDLQCQRLTVRFGWCGRVLDGPLPRPIKVGGARASRHCRWPLGRIFALLPVRVVWLVPTHASGVGHWAMAAITWPDVRSHYAFPEATARSLLCRGCCSAAAAAPLFSVCCCCTCQLAGRRQHVGDGRGLPAGAACKGRRWSVVEQAIRGRGGALVPPGAKCKRSSEVGLPVAIM